MQSSTDNSANQSKNGQPGFVSRPVQEPFVDNALREKIAPAGILPAASSGGLKSFYQANKIYVWAIVLGAIIIGILAFLAFRKPPAPRLLPANVKIDISAPETVQSGGEVVYKIKLENQDSQKLINLQLELTYPQGLSYDSSSPKSSNLSGSLFSVPDLIPGQNAVVIVKAKAVGNLNDTKQLVAKLTYKYSNFNSEFVKEQAFSVRLVASGVILELTGPTTSSNAQLVLYALKYKNSSGSEIKNARIQINYPEGFNFASANPQADLGNNIWSINVLSVNGEGEIQLQGNFKSSGPGEGKTLTAEFLILGQNADYYTQSTASFTTAIANLPLLVSQELESRAGDGVVDPGDTLNFRVVYQNNAATAASGVNIIATLNSKALDLSTLQAEGGLVNNNTILWNAASIPNLENLSPSESGELRFSVRVKNPATRDSSKNLSVISGIKIKANEYETFFPGNELTLKISSPAAIATRLDYSSGSLPPQVGKSTIYKVTISLSNSSNDFSDCLLTAFIPLGAGGFVSQSVNSAEAGKVEFDPTTGKLTWNVGTLPAFTGKFTQARKAEFSVRLIPSSSQVNNSVVLVKDINLMAKDLYTQQNIQISSDDLTTSDISGQSGYGNGAVVP